MNLDQPWRTSIADYILEQARPVEKYGHQPRLYALTREIGAGLSYDDDVLYATAWLHDLGVFTGHRPEDPVLLTQWDNVAYAVAETPALLHRFGFPATKIDAVLDCIRTHQPAATPQTLEATILRDADILEQLGAIGIARTLCKIGRDTRFATFTEASASLQHALDELPSKLRLPSAIVLAQSRIALHAAFLNNLRREASHSLH